MSPRLRRASAGRHRTKAVDLCKHGIISPSFFSKALSFEPSSGLSASLKEVNKYNLQRRSLMEQNMILIPQLPRPSILEIQGNYHFCWIREVVRDTSPIETVTLDLTTVLPHGAGSIGGVEYQWRTIFREKSATDYVEGFVSGAEHLRLRPDVVLLGYQHAQFLDGAKVPANLAGTYIDFPAIVARSQDGHLHIPFLRPWYDDLRNPPGERGWHWRWLLDWRSIEEPFFPEGRIAISKEVIR
jgi:hypothetical protein